MRNCTVVLLSAVFLATFTGCLSGVKSPSGFRLPDGDAQRGRATFLELKCNACHEVQGMDLPYTTAALAKPVVLGGEVLYVRTDGELVTAIVNPSHELAQGYPRELIESDGKSRMKDYSDEMTVRQLVDLVAFLHSCYKTVPPPIANL